MKTVIKAFGVFIILACTVVSLVMALKYHEFEELFPFEKVCYMLLGASVSLVCALVMRKMKKTYFRILISFAGASGYLCLVFLINNILHVLDWPVSLNEYNSAFELFSILSRADIKFGVGRYLLLFFVMLFLLILIAFFIDDSDKGLRTRMKRRFSHKKTKKQPRMYQWIQLKDKQNGEGERVVEATNRLTQEVYELGSRIGDLLKKWTALLIRTRIPVPKVKSTLC